MTRLTHVEHHRGNEYYGMSFSPEEPNVGEISYMFLGSARPVEYYKILFCVWNDERVPGGWFLVLEKLIEDACDEDFMREISS